MKTDSRRLWSVMGLAMAALAACGGPPPSPPALTATPVEPTAALIFIPGCATGDLENWLESTYFLLADAVSLMNQVEDQTPDQVRETIARLVPLRDALIAVPAPEECAAEMHRLTTQAVGDMLTVLQRFEQGEIPAIEPYLTDIDAALGRVQLMQAALEERLRAQFSAEQGTGN